MTRDRDTRTTLDGRRYTYDAAESTHACGGPDPANPASRSRSRTTMTRPVTGRPRTLPTGKFLNTANRLLEDSGFTYTYDLNGNLEQGRQDDGAFITYDGTWRSVDRGEYPSQTITVPIRCAGAKNRDGGFTTTRYLYDQDESSRTWTKQRSDIQVCPGRESTKPLARTDVGTGLTEFFHATAGQHR